MVDLYAQRKEEPEDTLQMPETAERENYEVRLMQTPGAVVSLEEDQSQENIEKIHRETEEALRESREQKGE